MRVSADLGCLQEARRMPNHPLYAATTIRWEENYVCSPIAMELPAEGTQKVEMQCPVCGEGMLLKLASIERFRLLLICVVGFIAVVIFGVGLLLTSFAGGDPVLRIAGLIGFGLGALVFAVALTLSFIKAEWLAWTNDILDISRDNVREQEMAPGFSGMRGHKLFNIRGA